MRWNKTATERRPVWPYIIEVDSIKAEIRGKIIKNDDTKGTWQAHNWSPGHEKIINSNARWNIFDQEAEWDRLSIELSASIDDFDSKLEKIIPDSSSQRFSLTVLCPKTRYRLAENSEMSEGKAHITINIHRKDVAGEIILSPSVILSDDVSEPAFAKARFKGARVVTGFPVYIFADEPEDRPGGGIEIRWAPFPTSKDALYRLHFDNNEGCKPILYFNDGYPEIKTILDSKSRRGTKRDIREALFSHIALDVWMQLAEFAAKNYGGESGEMEPHEILSGKILKTLSKKINYSINGIKDDIEDVQGKRNLNSKIQHMLKISIRERDLAKGVNVEGTEDED